MKAHMRMTTETVKDDTESNEFDRRRDVTAQEK
jgi:hypothetical protein